MQPVTIACLCPKRPDGLPRHESDTVYLRDRLDFQQAVALMADLRAGGKMEGVTEGELEAILAQRYVLYGVQSWSLVDEKGKALPASRENILRVLLGDYVAGMLVAGVADDLYTEAVVLPLVQMASGSSQTSPTPDSTSAKLGTSTPKPRSRSSTSTTRTAATGTTRPRPDGVSRHSPNSASAA